MEIEIVNWDKYNPRKDLKSLTWLRLDSDIGFSESLFGLNAEARWLWIFLLSFSAKKNKSTLNIDLDYIAYHSSVKKENILKHIESFSQKGLIQVIQQLPESDRIRTDTGESVLYERTNEHDEQDGNDLAIDFTHPLDLPCEKLTPEKIVESWNEGCEQFGMPKILKLNDQRKKKLKNFMNDVKTLEDWQNIFLVASTKSFTGKDGRKFIPSFDYILEKGRHLSLLEESKLAGLPVPELSEEEAEKVVRNYMREQGVAI